MIEGESDARLFQHLTRIAARDLSRFQQFYDLTSQRLFANCLGIVQNREAAEDVLQEVYIKILNRAAGFDPARGNPWSWLLMIARNTAIDRVRARGRRNGLDGQKYLIALDENAEQPIDETLASKGEGEEAMLAVGAYDAGSVECIRAAFFEGLTYSEIAERENLPLGTVKSRIRRGLQFLKRRMVDD